MSQVTLKEGDMGIGVDNNNNSLKSSYDFHIKVSPSFNKEPPELISEGW